MPGGQFHPGRPGYTGPYDTGWRKSYDGRGRCTATTRRAGDRRADVRPLGPGRWLVTITPVCPRYGGRWWEPCGAPVELGVYGGRHAGMAAADEYLAAGR